MTLLSSWQDSLRVFKPSHFSIFIKNVVHRLIQTYVLWVRDWWIVYLPVLVWFAFQTADYFFNLQLYFWVLGIDVVEIMQKESFYIMEAYGLFVWLFYDLIIASKAGVKREWSVLFSQKLFEFFSWERWAYIGLWLLALPYLWKGWKFLYMTSGYDWDRPGSVLGLILLFSFALSYVFVVSSFSLFFTFFLTDSNGSVTQALASFKRAFRMLLFNLAFCLIMGSILWVVGGLLKILLIKAMMYSFELFWDYDRSLHWTRTIIILVDYFLFFPVVVCVARQFYAERVKDFKH